MWQLSMRIPLLFRSRKSKAGPRSQDRAVRAWMCGRLGPDEACRAGPSARGRCGSRFACEPEKSGSEWHCRRRDTDGGPCADGPNADGSCRIAEPPCKPVRTLRARRELVAKWAAAVSAGAVALLISYAQDPEIFGPGPLTTAHGPVGDCKSCHTSVADGQLGWIHSIVATADSTADSRACLTCHKMPGSELKPHGLSEAQLAQISRSFEPEVTSKSASAFARLSSALFPIDASGESDIFCASCHQEHQGKMVDLTTMSDARCHTCHKMQFSSFSKDHPEFDNFPFRRRTRIAFDHSGHFGKHFPELTAKGGKEKESVPSDCADCHTSGTEGRHMGVKPFAEACSSCHLGQIVGDDRATGPKGIALLTLPGLDVETLNEKKAEIGAWPAESEAEITPLMKLLIGRDEERRAMLQTIADLDLLDLTEASDEELKAVTRLVWEIKSLVHSLVTSKMSQVLNKIGSGSEAEIDTDLIAKLTANMPRDVFVNAQREWLPNLGKEMRARLAGAVKPEPDKDAVSPSPATQGKETPKKESKLETRPTRKRTRVASERWRIDAFGNLVKGDKPANDADSAEDTQQSDEPENEPERTAEPEQETKPETASQEAETQEEAPENEGTSDTAAVDPESWAEFGGWYRMDYAILYKPTGHADGFLRAWLDFSGRLSGPKDSGLVSPVFALLSSKDAQGQCTKCHSVDQGKGESRRVNWSPSSLNTRASKFTAFNHEPHFGLVADKSGCLTCHALDDKAGFMDSYKAHDPKNFRSNFKPVKKQTCSECHGNNVAREDCLLCHTYHVDGVTTPITMTKIPGVKK